MFLLKPDFTSFCNQFTASNSPLSPDRDESTQLKLLYLKDQILVKYSFSKFWLYTMLWESVPSVFYHGYVICPHLHL